MILQCLFAITYLVTKVSTNNYIAAAWIYFPEDPLGDTDTYGLGYVDHLYIMPFGCTPGCTAFGYAAAYASQFTHVMSRANLYYGMKKFAVHGWNASFLSDLSASDGSSASLQTLADSVAGFVGTNGFNGYGIDFETGDYSSNVISDTELSTYVGYLRSSTNNNFNMLLSISPAFDNRNSFISFDYILLQSYSNGCVTASQIYGSNAQSIRAKVLYGVSLEYGSNDTNTSGIHFANIVNNTYAGTSFWRLNTGVNNQTEQVMQQSLQQALRTLPN